MMAKLVGLKESMIIFYKKHVDVILPIWKLVFAFFA